MRFHPRLLALLSWTIATATLAQEWSPSAAQVEASEEAASPVLAGTAGGQEYVLVPAGSFEMGDRRKTQARVTLTRAFYVKRTEVTASEWEAVMGDRSWCKATGAGGARAPVQVFFHAALEFCNALSVQEGLEPAYRIEVIERDLRKQIRRARVEFLGLDRTGYRLPTEAEWEYACRAGTTTDFHTGNDLTSGQACFEDHDGPADVVRDRSVLVGCYPPNAWGLFDAHGSVREWCWWSPIIESWDGAVELMDPIESAETVWQVTRGGGADDDARGCRSAARDTGANDWAGFRPVRSIPRTDRDTGAVVEWWTPRYGQREAAAASGVPLAMTSPSGLQLVFCPAGRFPMGRDREDCPRHEVLLTRSFYMSSTEVNRATWRAVMGDDPSRFASSGDSAPVESVTWAQAIEFCNVLSTREGLDPAYELDGAGGVHFLGLDRNGYRLPTEAEWEYAEQGGRGWTSAVEPMSVEEMTTTDDVRGQFPNEWGLYYLCGNVAEWCWDWYGDYPEVLAIDPLGPGVGTGRIQRGGKMFHGREFDPTHPMGMGAPGSTFAPSRGFDRRVGEPEARSRYVGFRVVRSGPIDPKWGRDDLQGEDRRIQASLRIGRPHEVCTPGTGLLLNLIPEGSFERPLQDGRPSIVVTIGHPFYMSRYEFTWKDWKRLTGAGRESDDPRPMTWFDAVDCCNHLSTAAGLQPAYELANVRRDDDGSIVSAQVTLLDPLRESYRLPTEAEWEHAARAGSREWDWADGIPTTDSANVVFEAKYRGRPVAVGSYVEPNAWGLYDVHGNVSEWCWDLAFEYATRSVVDPLTSGGAKPLTHDRSARIHRGGGWKSEASDTGFSRRHAAAPGTIDETIGFRPVLPVPAPAAPPVDEEPPDRDGQAEAAIRRAMALARNYALNGNRERAIEELERVAMEFEGTPWAGKALEMAADVRAGRLR